MTSACTGASLSTPRTVASAASATRAARPVPSAISRTSCAVLAASTLSRGSSGSSAGQPVELHLRAAGMQVQCALRQLGDLAEAAADRHARHRMGAEIFEQPAGEIAHVQHGLQRQAEMRPHRIFGGRPGAARHMRQAPWRAPRRCRGGWRRSRPRRKTDARCPWCRGSRARPRMPSRGFQVFSASASPPGIEISISAAVPPSSAIACIIIWRGTGLMAGSPGGMGSPPLVTMPTPGPALKRMPSPPSRTVATTMQPWVTSGSSPASLMMPARAQPSPRSSSASGKLGVSPFGQRDRHGIGEHARPQCRKCRLHCRRCACARGPAAP